VLLGGIVVAAVLAAGAAGPAPVDVSARSFSIDEDRCVWIWRGDARLKTRDGVLRADAMEGYAAKLEQGGRTVCGPLQRIEAAGNLVLETPRAQLTGVSFAVYDVGTRYLDLSGGAFSVDERD
jgi:lipopolysaccharide export system protein LptA